MKQQYSRLLLLRRPTLSETRAQSTGSMKMVVQKASLSTQVSLTGCVLIVKGGDSPAMAARWRRPRPAVLGMAAEPPAPHDDKNLLGLTYAMSS